MAASNWNPGLTISVGADAPNDSDVDGADFSIGWNVPLFRTYRSPDTTLQSADVWIPGTYKNNGFFLTSWHYPLMPTDVMTHYLTFSGGQMLGEIKDVFFPTYPIFSAGSLQGTVITLATQATESFQSVSLVYSTGTLTVVVITLPTQDTEVFSPTGITYIAGGSLVVMVVTLATQPTDSFASTGITFSTGTLS